MCDRKLAPLVYVFGLLPELYIYLGFTQSIAHRKKAIVILCNRPDRARQCRTGLGTGHCMDVEGRVRQRKTGPDKVGGAGQCQKPLSFVDCISYK